MKSWAKQNEPYLKLKIRGGLGNQLFQLSGALFHTKRLDAHLIVDETALKTHHDISRRNWVNKLDLSGLTSGTEIKWVSDSRIKIPCFKYGFDNIDEHSLANLEKLEKSLFFRGWFQQKVFSEKLQITKKDLAPLEISTVTKQILSQISNVDGVAGMHMRFGDFKGTTWGILSSDWYGRVIKELEESRVSHIHVYTDDISTAEKILGDIPHEFSISFPEKNGQLMPNELLWILRQYKTFVSSNSTLSWWASYLNINSNPRIYCSWDDNLFIEPWIKVP
jgi:hypothetical protein